MFDTSDPNLFWLNVTNVVLGLVVLGCVSVLMYGVAREVAARVRVPKLRFLEVDDHAFSTPDLGITMADGGHRIDQKSATLVNEQGELHSDSSPSDEPNIIRSVN